MENTLAVKEIKNATLRKATERISKCTHAIATNAYTIAAILAKIDEAECYTEDGFKNVAEYAETFFGMKKSTTYEYIKIGREYVENNHSNLPHAEVDFTHKQVAALLPLKNRDRAVELIEDGTITVDTPVSEIKKIVKAETSTEVSTEEKPEENPEKTIEETAEENENLFAEIASTLHDMRAAYSRFMELVEKCRGIDPENAQNFAGFVTLINNTEI